MFQKISKEVSKEVTEQVQRVKEMFVDQPWLKAVGWHGSCVLIYVIDTAMDDKGRKLIQEKCKGMDYEIMGFGKKRIFYG
jgi:hypothetical protein